MKISVLLIALFLFTGVSAQNIAISFSSKKAGVVVDSILVTNQRTGQKVKLTEMEQLNLAKTTGVTELNQESGPGYVYPNPCTGEACLVFSTGSSGRAALCLYNSAGQLLSSYSGALMPGVHRFSVRFPVKGIYFLSLNHDQKQYGYNVICLNTPFKTGTIESMGADLSGSAQSLKEWKSAIVPKTMIYLDGDILQCSAFSGKNTTIIADSPVSSKVYEVEFYPCVDAGDFNYPIVKIGDQWWMALNLQSVKYSDGSAIANISDNAGWSVLTTGAYCWYKNDAANKIVYGALYNWFAVKTNKICPSGWHVPSDAEWTTFENYLINNGFNYDGTKTGNKIAKSIAVATLWTSNATVGVVGNPDYPAYRNKSGFSALPAGYRDYTGTFGSVSNECYWWSSTENSTTNALFRYLYTNFANVGRYNYDKLHGFSIRCIKD